MHTSSGVDVYISIASNPIIEHCSAIRFADYPSSLRPTSLSATQVCLPPSRCYLDQADQMPRFPVGYQEQLFGGTGLHTHSRHTVAELVRFVARAPDSRRCVATLDRKCDRHVTRVTSYAGLLNKDREYGFMAVSRKMVVGVLMTDEYP